MKNGKHFGMSTKEQIYQDDLERVKKLAQDWISVKDRLPDEYDRVLIYKAEIGLICFGLACYSAKRFRFDATCLPCNAAMEAVSDKPINGVTHWQPLPELPKK